MIRKKRIHSLILVITLISALFLSCNKNKEMSQPTVSMQPSTTIEKSSLTSRPSPGVESSSTVQPSLNTQPSPTTQPSQNTQPSLVTQPSPTAQPSPATESLPTIEPSSTSQFYPMLSEPFSEEETIYPDTIDFSNEQEIYDMFDFGDYLVDSSVTIDADNKLIIQQGTVNNTSYTLTVNLELWDGFTTPKQIVTCVKLFWYCYPQMYDRFAVTGTPTDVILAIENEGYEIACAYDNIVHIHDNWLYENPIDFDCLTHEFSHIVQTEWDGEYVPSSGDDTYMIERFADYCRYIYAFRNGYYNDFAWVLQTAADEDSYVTGNRFWVWLDYTYSNDNVDIIKSIATLVQNKTEEYKAENWVSSGSAWLEVFKGTKASGKTLDQLWEEYASSDFSYLSAESYELGGISDLLDLYPIRK